MEFFLISGGDPEDRVRILQYYTGSGTIDYNLFYNDKNVRLFHGTMFSKGGNEKVRMGIHVRRAKISDTERIQELLVQVCNVHAEGRPDIFVHGRTKYTSQELHLLIRDDTRPIFVAEDDQGIVRGYAFCIVTDTSGSNFLQNMKELYIDDICVDSACRRMKVGSILYDAVKAYAREAGCYHMTLNVWSCNPSAMAFYESRGMKTLKQSLEEIL